MNKIAANKLAIALSREVIETHTDFPITHSSAEELVKFLECLSKNFEKSEALSDVNTQIIFHLFARKGDK